MRPTVGYKASAEYFPPAELLEFAVLAERRGFDAVTVSEYFQPWWHRSSQAPVSVAWLGWLGDRTERVRLGTSVLTPALRHEPAVVARAFARLACRHPGRVFLGLGTGENRGEATPLGMDWPPFRERLERLAESIELMRRLWTEESVTYGGDYYTALRAGLPVRPPAPLPIHVAASGPRGARAAGRIADGLICKGGLREDLYPELLAAADDGAWVAERDPAAIARTIEVGVSYDPDPAYAAAVVEDEGPRGRFIVSPDPAEVAERLGRYADMGFGELVVRAPGRDQARFISSFSRDVMPLLRERTRPRAAAATGVC
jgi:coenzyme F420-dependent glucose-6-phosphate dehydrogenase